MNPSSSSPPMEIATPPDSVRQYANALKAFTRVGMDAAIADSRDASRIQERRFDIEFGYDDEDPIERHVRLYLTPKKGAEKVAEGSGTENQEMLHVDVEERRGSIDEMGPGGVARAFRPGLIHFQRSSRGSVPSLTTSAPSYTRTDSSMSTPFGFDNDRLRDMDTPGSTWSDASFEALKPDDWVSLYGPQGARKRQQSWHGEREEAENRNSMASDTTAQGSPPAGPSKRPSLMRPRPRAYPYPPPPEVIRSRQNSGRIDVVDCRGFSPEPRSRTTSIGSISGSRSRIPSDNVPTATLASLSYRTRQSSDTASVHTIGSRSRHPSDDVKIAKLSALGLGSAPASEDDEDWMMGRTISETMVVQAGFRSQKGRATVRIAR